MGGIFLDDKDAEVVAFTVELDSRLPLLDLAVPGDALVLRRCTLARSLVVVVLGVRRRLARRLSRPSWLT